MRKTTIKEFLNDIIPENKIDLVNRSFEIVGDIAICEINEELIEFEKEIGVAIMKVNPSIKTVLKKSGIHSGEFRTQDLIYIAGENKKETIYQENGIKLLINPETVYFSARLSVERQELMSQLKENKRVLVMFSGIGPYTFVALKKQPNLARITSIELNPEGHRFAVENLNLNKNLLKKSKLFKSIIEYLRSNKLPIFEKKIISNLNNLKINQINADVKKEVKKFKLNKYSNEIKNEKFINLDTSNPKELFNLFKDSKEDNLYFNLDIINEKNNLLNIIVLFVDRYNFICRINNMDYIFDSDSSKEYLINYLEGFKIENITKFDEIYMPLPKDAELFLEDAFLVADKNCIIHMYDFVEEENYPNKTETSVKKYANQCNKKVRIIKTRKVGQYAPGKYRVCCDFIVK